MVGFLLVKSYDDCLDIIDYESGFPFAVCTYTHKKITRANQAIVLILSKLSPVSALQ